MGIKWTVSHPQRLITAVGEVPVTATEILHCTDEFAKTVLFLLSDDARFLTGLSLPVDGGHTRSLF